MQPIHVRVQGSGIQHPMRVTNVTIPYSCKVAKTKIQKSKIKSSAGILYCCCISYSKYKTSRPRTCSSCTRLSLFPRLLDFGLAPSPPPTTEAHGSLVVRHNGLSSRGKYVLDCWPALRDVYCRRVVYAVRGGSFIFVESHSKLCFSYSIILV